jgi:hypothetical protein
MLSTLKEAISMVRPAPTNVLSAMTREMASCSVVGESEVTALLGALEEEFPEWHCWRSDHGWLWATRRGRNASYREHIPMTIDAATVDELRQQLVDLATDVGQWACQVE